MHALGRVDVKDFANDIDGSRQRILNLVTISTTTGAVGHVLAASTSSNEGCSATSSSRLLFVGNLCLEFVLLSEEVAIRAVLGEHGCSKLEALSLHFPEFLVSKHTDSLSNLNHRIGILRCNRCQHVDGVDTDVYAAV